MRSFRVIDGDLLLDTGGRAQKVERKEKLLQDLRLWLMEPIGIGFTTPRFGSILQDKIGSYDPRYQAFEIAEEVTRILQLYQNHQLEQIKKARVYGMLAQYSRQEILNSIDKVKATPRADGVVVTAYVSTATGESLTLPIEISPEGLVV